MRLNNYLTEVNTSDNFDEIVALIKKDCQPFLKEFNPSAKPVWRGTEKDFNGSLIKVKSRRKRTPKDIPEHLHKVLDKLFKKHHGWNTRSEGVFVSKDSMETKSYGTPRMFFPKGNYKYLWNINVEDLYTTIRTDISKILYPKRFVNTRELKQELVTPEFIDMLDDIIKEYNSTGFGSTTRSTSYNECMFKVNEYYLVDFGSGVRNMMFLQEIQK